LKAVSFEAAAFLVAAAAFSLAAASYFSTRLRFLRTDSGTVAPPLGFEAEEGH